MKVKAAWAKKKAVSPGLTRLKAQSRGKTARFAIWFGKGLPNVEFNSSVLGTPFRTVVRRNWFSRSFADRCHTPSGNSVAHQPCFHRLSPTERKFLILGRVADIVGISGDFHRHARLILKGLICFVEDSFGAWRDYRAP
jgi:hypothetical protein